MSSTAAIAPENAPAESPTQLHPKSTQHRTAWRSARQVLGKFFELGAPAVLGACPDCFGEVGDEVAGKERGAG
jgi:hypothetical protein